MSFGMVSYSYFMLQKLLIEFFEVVISNRLVTSPCAIVADEMGYTANVEKLISALTMCLPYTM